MQYVPKMHWINWRDCLIVPSIASDLTIPDHIIISCYDLVDQQTAKLDWDKLGKGIEHKIEEGEIEIHSGIGFAIASQGVLNVNMWRNKPFPSVLNTQVYDTTTNPYHRNDEQGTFCMFELRLLDRLAALRHKYLCDGSKRQLHDMLSYAGKLVIGADGTVEDHSDHENISQLARLIFH
jgi:hypothetical protein